MKKRLKRMLRRMVVACLIAAMLVGVMPADMLQVGMEKVEAASYEYAMMPMSCLNVSRGESGHGSDRTCIDFAGADTGKDAFYAPFSGKVVRTYSDWGGTNHDVIIESSTPVQWADGTIAHVCIWLAHDNDVSDMYVGKTFQQGEEIYREGNYGDARGNCVHLVCGKGKYSELKEVSSGWTINNQVSAYDVFYLYEDTVIKDNGGYTWKTLSGVYSNYTGSSTPITSSFPLQNNGFYKIVSALSGKTMEVSCGTTQNSKQINLWSYTGEPWMQWKAVQQSDGYSFINAYTGKALDIQNGSASASAKLTQYDYNGSAAQRFKLIDKGDGKYGMLAVCSDMAVDVCGSVTNDGALLDQHEFHGGNNQLWTFELIDTTPPEITDIKVTNLSSTGYTVTCTVDDNVGVTSVLFPTWTDANGQDDLPSQWPSYTDISGKTYSYDVKISDHNNEGGGYTTHIYAYDAAGNNSNGGICVTVNKEVPLSGFNLNASSLNMYKGASETLYVTAYSPSDTTANKTATWSSSDSNVASVNNSGVVTAHTAGTAVITCTVAEIKRTCTVTVSEVSADSWSDWTTSLSEDITGNPTVYEVQQKTQYRSRTKKTTTSNQSSLEGCTKYGEYWGEWQSSNTEVVANESREVQRVDTFVKTQYKYNHWHSYSKNMTSPRENSGWTFEETGWLDYALTYYGESSIGGAMYKGSSALGPCGWATNWYNQQTQDVYNTTWNYRDKVYQFYQWSDWSGWSDSAVTPNDNVQVETRTVYRYRKLSYPLKFERLILGGDGLVVNRPMTFTAVASGGQPAYQYRFMVLDEGTGENIVLRDYNTSDTCEWTPTKSGTYPLTINVKDSASTEITWNGSVTISPEPIVILSQPMNLSLEWGQNGAFNVQVAGDGYTYQWYKCGKDSDKFMNITTEGCGYNTNTLQVKGDVSNKDAQFKCIIFGKENQIAETDVVTLEVLIPQLYISEQPVSATVEEGSSAYFSVKASGAGLQYQWQYCKNNSEEWTDYTADDSGSSEAVLQVMPSKEMSGVQFRCVITDCLGNQSITDSVVLNVTEKVTVYTIEYILNGGVNNEDNVNAYCAGETIALKDPFYEGKEFGGWFTLDGEQITSVSGGNIIVEARWHNIVNSERQNGELWIEEIPAQLYTGKAIKPVVAVYNGQVLLREKIDYTVTYKNNINVNDASETKNIPTVTVTGKGNYTKKEVVTFDIMAKDISDEDITADNLYLPANGKVQKPSPIVTWNNKKLKAGVDFTVEYPDTTAGAYQNNGTYKVCIKGKGNFCGERTVQLQITGSNLLSKAKVSKIAEQAYTGKEIKPEFTVSYGSTVLTKGVDYTVSYRDNISAGSATVVLTGKGNYTGEKKVTFKIVGNPIHKAKVTKLPKSVVYEGNAVNDLEYQVQMVDAGRTVTLVEGQDYTVSYRNNSSVGTASIRFTGINGYSGVLKKTFKIIPYDIKKDSEKAVIISADSEVAYMKGSTILEPKITCFGTTLKKGRDYKLTYKNNKQIFSGTSGEKAPTVTITGTGNYSGSLVLTYAITKQNIGVLAMTAADKVFQEKAGKQFSNPVIKDVNGKVLTAGTDYEKEVKYTYTANTKLANGTLRKAGDVVWTSDILPAGTSVTVTATGKGNYTGTIKCTYRIVQADISKGSGKITTQTYTGKEIKPGKADITMKVGRTTLSDKDYEIVGYKNNIRKGTATVIIKGVGNYGGTKEIKFSIKSKTFSWWWR